MQKHRITKIVSWEDLLLAGISSWLIQKILDFLWKKAKVLHLEGRTHFSEYIFIMFGEVFLTFVFSTLPDIIELQKRKISQNEVRGFLRGHKRYHQLSGKVECAVCPLIEKNRRAFEKFVPDSELYPPFLR